MQLLEVPFPALTNGTIMVRNHYSVISTGTEGKTVKDARLGYIGKAKARKEEVKKVVQAAKTHGVMKTYKMVMNKLEKPSPLGYSCAGEVIAVAPDVKEFKVGDRVACAGGTANHAEVVVVPKNLCAKVDPSIALNHATFATIAAIALQGIRQADLRLGENCVIIGLGLVGQLTIQMLNAAGVKTIGIDIAPKSVELAAKAGADVALVRDTEGLEEIVMEHTNGYGTDAVIITAGTSSLDPVELAGALSRKKGKVVIVGAVPTGFSRKNYYKKELELKMSSSYGPGRHDATYEEKGIDYPIGYVRWTENRNMQAYLDLLKANKLNVAPLLTHEFAFDDAREAYQMILDKSQSFTGVLLKYNIEKKLKPGVAYTPKVLDPAEPNVGFIGAGSFAQNFLLPAVKDKANLVHVATARANNARNIADKYGFDRCTGDASELLANQQVNTVFITTRHNLHTKYVLEALEQHKQVFVEKPLCMTEEELEQIKVVHEQSEGSVMVGFNRRFAPQVQQLSALFANQLPKAINYRINAGNMPPDHWIHDPEVGGGRIIGEVCHFIDLCTYIADAPVSAVSATVMKSMNDTWDTLCINLSMQNGSVASISYFSNGSKQLGKEYLEVFCGNQSVVIDDFKTMTIYNNGVQKSKLSAQDKGHAHEVTAYLDAIRKGQPLPIPFEQSHHSTLVTFKVMESIREGTRITLAPS